MYRFLVRPRWIAGHVLLVVTVVAFVNLGFWQLHRLDERRASNERIAARLAAQPIALDDLLRTVGADVSALEYRRVTVDGRYQPDTQVLTGPRSRDGRPGPQVLTVLHRGSGAVLVDRGWIPFNRDMVTAPPPPAGDVRVEGVVRAAEPGAVGDGDQVAHIVPAQIAERIGAPLAPFYIELWAQQPPARDAPLPAGPPQLSEGSHQSYALQWFSFALIALLGYPLLIWRVARDDGRDADPGDGDDPGDGGTPVSAAPPAPARLF